MGLIEVVGLLVLFATPIFALSFFGYAQPTELKELKGELMELIKVVGFLALFATPIFILSFFGYAKARELKERKEELPNWLIAFVYIGLVYFAILDILWNIIVGSVVFHEPPRFSKKEFFFTGRVKRWVRKADAAKAKGDTSKLYRRAYYWRDLINTIDPGHV